MTHAEPLRGTLHDPDDRLLKVYVEPTNRCNLNCRTCIRNVWDEAPGTMEWSTYEALIDGLAEFSEVRTVAFAGLGEPLLHPRFVDMVRLAHARGLRTEVTTNALLLTPDLGAGLLDAGLDQMVVSIDGVSAGAFGDVRGGASLAQVIENVRAFVIGSQPSPLPPVRIGIEFVAMKSNIAELPQLAPIALRIAASFVIVTNVIAYTPELADQVLYHLRATAFEGQGSPWTPRWYLPKMDLTDVTREPLLKLLRTQANLSFLDLDLSSRNNYCPFINTGAMAVAWHGGVSPCPPLLHSYTCHVMRRVKRIERYQIDRLSARSLRSIWEEPAYAAFRQRVRDFDFPPCTDCGCELAEKNEEDCYGNPFPVCGDCLWARGLIRCA